MELISKLGINLGMLAAQLVNFLLLLFILKKFVYGPVLEKLEQRRNMIAKSVSDSKAADETLKDIEKARSEMIEKTKSQSLAMIEAAAASAEEAKNSITESARREAQAIFEQSKLQIAREKEKMLKEASEELGRLVVKAAEKIIEREFTPEDQKRLAMQATEQFGQK
ncbi:MAG: F0F1 ATP synthase subunit B [Candidatus Peregrinibacteria bacterium]|nr:F0F1 ATP synthase subunit B [Candidatus Peregrinibacteria bacterium]